MSGDEELIPMVEVIQRFKNTGWTLDEIAEAFARTGPGGEDELTVVNDIVARRGVGDNTE